MRRASTAAGLWLCFAVTTATAGPPDGPPRALPVHSALPADNADVPAFRTASLPPPSSEQPDFVPLPPFGSPQPSEPMLIEPPPAPLWSWRPTYVPPGARSGVFQQSLFRTTYLPRFGAGGFGMTDVTKQFTFALPPFISGSPILISPSATSHFLDGPATIDLPSELYDFELEFRYLKQLSSRWGIDLAVAPSYFGDLHNDGRDAWRVTGRALAAWDWTPKVKLVFGALVLGRSDYPAIPAGGVIWKPTPDWRFDFIIPRPRFSYRTFVSGDVEHRVYVGGEFGGNTWAVDRLNTPDKVTYSDLRLTVGWERYTSSGLKGRIEAGWVFDRTITFQSNAPGFDPNDTLLVRGELSY